MTSSAIKTAPKARVYASEEKWGKPLIKTGFTIFPSILLEYQARLELDPVDLNLLLQIIKHWWTKDKAPFPSRNMLAKAIGRTTSTVQRRLTRLKDRKLIKIHHRFYSDHGGQTSSGYTFEGLIEKATALAEEKLAESAEHKAKNAHARKRQPRSTNTVGLKIAKTKN
jgi:hypothetical protein